MTLHDRVRRGAPHVVVLTGAGISADSGVRTYRGAGGLWEGRRLEEVATPQAWAQDPRTVWRFYQERRRALATVRPNAAHLALAECERELRAVGGSLTLVSQNVDDLHQRAGSGVLAMHGQLCELRCESCGTVVVDRARFDADAFVPCANCGHPRLRPNVVWFGEVPHHLAQIESALVRCTDFAAIGTSGAVYPAAGLLAAARDLGARTWVQSLDAPENLDPRDRFLPGRAFDVVPALVADWCR
jgi:NAD-dependent deacetylase